MPQHKSAEKRVRQNARRRLRNKADLSRMKTVAKKVRGAKDKETAQSALKTATRVLDKLAAKGVIHKNQASNQKSRLTKFVNSMK